MSARVPFVANYRQRGDENIPDTKTSDAAQPGPWGGEGRTRLALRNTKSKWAKDVSGRPFRVDDNMPSPSPPSLDVDEKVSFQDVLALFVLL